MARHIRKGDNVIVTAGHFKGQQGKVLRVIPDEDRCVVEGINLRKKHRNVREGQNIGPVNKEMPIHISNVSPCVDGKPTRVRFETRDDGSKVRIAVRTGEQIGPEIRKAKNKAKA
ncbi:MAG: 50S ribosomal protein L24 [Planctomycetota bacterium]